jgi:hypothetical protein
MNTSLYVLANEYQSVANKLLEMDLDEQTIKDTLEGFSGDLEVKAKNVAMFIRNLESSAEQIKLAESEMAKRRKALENKAQSIKDYLFNNMKLANINKIECEYFALTIKKNPPKLVVDDAGKIPSDLYIYPEAPAPYPDNAKIKELLKNGQLVDGAYLQQDERLEIK